MSSGNLSKKVRKKLGLPSSNPPRVQKSSPTKIQVQPSGKGCCGKSR